jgi:NADP-dependent 3-hydroxy acid dehydrogenase YdfG
VSTDLTGRRILVVGASEGIGKAFAEQAVRAGASVILSARRADALEAVAKSAGGGHVAVVDVTDDDSLDELVSTAVATFGQIDLLLYAVGSASLGHLVHADRESWNETLAINVVGFNQLARRVIGVMAPSGIIVVLSSEASSVPRDGLIAYAASKAALETSVKGWRAEHPEVRWSSVAVGATYPTAFGATFEPELLGTIMDRWVRKGLLQNEFMVPNEVGAHLLTLFTSALSLTSVNVEHLVLRSPSPIMGVDVPPA